DHAGGLTKTAKNGKLVPTFPNARYFISRRNWEAGLKPNLRDRASYLAENYVPLQEAGVLELAEDNAQILPGISTYTVNGHTNGQQLIKITDGGETLMFVADLIPLKSHLKLPWIMGYDLHAALTLTEKTSFLKKAAAENWWLWFYHDPATAAVRIQPGKKYYDITEELPGG
ncbi:MAG: MBL fold metallo-hydrolase, partial [FCB group bacterium]|nr:MBL fold metallo-hydrolase [FCB group bacterium]